MTVALLDSGQRVWILAAALAAGLIAGVLAWRRASARASITCAAVAVVAAATVAVDRAVALLAGAAAPDTAAFNEHRWVLLAPWGGVGVALGAAATVAIVTLGWIASRRIASPWRRAVLVGLRAGAALAALVLLLEPAIELRQVAREPNRIAILVDDSRSMALRDDPDGPTRAERARALLDRSAATFRQWREDHDIDVYALSDGLSPSSLESAAAGDPGGEATLIRLGLEQARARYDGADLAGIVLVSDGAATGEFERGVSRGAAREFLRALEAPVHTAWAGRGGLKDVAVARVLADEFAFVRTVVPVEVVIRTTGYDARRIPVTLSKGGEPMRRQWVRLEPGQSEARVEFEFTPEQVGKYVYEISTPVADDEAVAENNQRAFILRVIRDKIRVLQVAGQPTWDVHALRRMLKQNPNVDLISFFILRTQDDVSLVPNDELSLIPFPTRELFQNQLPSFDVIVLQNFNFLPYRLARYLDNIRSYVDDGGSLVMLGGELSFASGHYRGTPVGEALPVELPRTGGDLPLLDTEPFSPELTGAGASHPITSLRYQTDDNRAAWRELPPLHGVNTLLGARPGSAVLAVHPELETPAGDPMPVIVAGEHGDGRTLAVTTDSLWRWGFVGAGQRRGDGRHYHELWENAIRWLIRDPALQYLRASADRVEYGPGDTATVEVALLDRSYEPLPGAAVTVEVERLRRGGSAGEVVAKAELQTGDRGRASRPVEDVKPGVYRVRARSQVAGEPVTARDLFLVRGATSELERPAADGDLLADIAGATGGSHLGPASELPADLAFEEPRIIRVDRRAEVELWSRPALLILALVFLGLEWGLRQKAGSR